MKKRTPFFAFYIKNVIIEKYLFFTNFLFMNKIWNITFDYGSKDIEVTTNENFLKSMHEKIPELDPKVTEMFSWADKKWKKIPIIEELSSKPKESVVIRNTPLKWKAMAWPAYYKNPRLAPDESWLWELAYMAHDRLQASPLVKVRPEVKDRLDRCQKILDSNKQTAHLQIVVVDWYRKLKDQKILFETYRNWLKNKNTEWDNDTLDIEAQKMVSIPPKDRKTLEQFAPPHSTWWSVDIVLVDKSKIDITKDDWVRHAMIDFWSDFDEMMHPEFGDTRSETRFFEWSDTTAEQNRRLLFNLMTQFGWFTNYHTEWWHFDFGNQFYAACKWLNEAEYWFAGWINNENEISEDNTAEIIVLDKYKKNFWWKVSKVIEEDFGVREWFKTGS